MPWIATVLGAVVARVLTFAMGFLAYSLAKRLAIVTGFIVAWSALFIAMAGTVKALIIGMRIVMPPVLAQFTYFLPSSINTFIAALVSVRLIYFVWEWTQANLSAYANVGMRGMPGVG